MTKPDRVAECWETVAVTALPPGWRNVFVAEDDKSIYTPCPAILLQENRSGESPYPTRVVYADDIGGELDMAAVLNNYIGTEWSNPAEPATCSGCRSELPIDPRHWYCGGCMDAAGKAH